MSAVDTDKIHQVTTKNTHIIFLVLVDYRYEWRP